MTKKTTPDKNPPDNNSPPGELGTTIRVRSKGPRFRRAGIEFTREGVDLDPTTLAPEQLEAIQNESQLVVELSDFPKKPKD